MSEQILEFLEHAGAAISLIAVAVILLSGTLKTKESYLSVEWSILFLIYGMLALGVALYLTSRKVHRREVITLDHARIRIEKGIQQVIQSWEFDTTGTRLIDEQTGDRYPRRKLIISAHGKKVEVGEFLDSLEKDELAFKLKDCIIHV